MEHHTGWGVLEQAAAMAQRDEAFALATVVWRQGPSSGKECNRAIVTASGEVHGWIGGACAEPVIVRQAREVLADGTPRLLLLGPPDQIGGAVREGTTVVPISCQSEGALEVFLEPVRPAPRVVVVGRSPMAHTLVDLVTALGWRAKLVDGATFSSQDVPRHGLVVVATQGHHDEEALEQALTAEPGYIALVGSRKRGEAVLGYLADRGIDQEKLDMVRVPAGLDLGHVSHREIAVCVLAELVKLRAAGELPIDGVDVAEPADKTAEAVDPVCGMTVPADESSRPFEYQGQTYYFCCPGCRRAFSRDPEAYLSDQPEEARC